jgi:hypothetical protein
LGRLFIDTVETMYEIFGEDAFLPPVYERRITKPQKTIYDPLMQSLAKHIEIKDELIKHAAKIKKKKYERETVVNNERIFYGRNTLPPIVKTRIEYFDALFEPYLK